MIVEKSVTKQVTETVDIICNMCGESCKVGNVDVSNYAGATHIMAEGTYGSDHLEDSAYYEFSLCECCCSKLFNDFEIPPRITRYNG